MGDKTTIEWTDATWNPVRGCSIVSQGCTNCYAMRQAHRSSGAGGAYEGLTKISKGGPVWTGAIRTVPELLDQPLRWRRPRRIFVNSMSDLFHEDVPDEFITKVWTTMASAPQHVFQILTKRPQRMRDYLLLHLSIGDFIAPPLPNVWLGVSVEDQVAAYERIPLLLQTPAAVRWISAEPLLGPLNLRLFLSVTTRGRGGDIQEPGGLDWVVAGGESGPGARPMHPDWARAMRDQCATAGAPFFFKQWGNWTPITKREDLPGHPALVRKGDLFIARDGSRMVNLGDDLSCDFESEAAPMRNVGKKLAGRALDGRTHDEYPT